MSFGNPNLFSVIFSLGLFASVVQTQPCHAGEKIEVTGKPGGKWRSLATTRLSDFPASKADDGLDRFGGTPSKLSRQTGFFHVETLNNRCWLITPEGGLFLSRGMNSVNRIDTTGGKAALKKKFGTPQAWAEQTLGLLRDGGLNTLGAWSDSETLISDSAPMARTLLWSFMSSYGKKRGGTRQDAGHTGYPNDCPFIFDPEFPTFCDEYAHRLSRYKDDPWVIGHFSDNELPWSRKMLQNFLALPPEDPGHQAAAKWLQARPGKSGEKPEITETDRADFLSFAIHHYLTITSAAIRKYAPNHLVLGPRLHSPVYDLPEVFSTLGKNVDVVSLNYYHAWAPDKERLAMWHRESGKPLMITEFYAKADDSGMGNTGGAGWLVKTQQDRGAFYENFTLGLIESRTCVGWSWHRYADNDPADKKIDPSNRDSNKGIVSNRYVPFTELLESMKSVNTRAYGLSQHFDSPHP